MTGPMERTQQGRAARHASRLALAAVRCCVDEYLAFHERYGRLPAATTIRTIPHLLAYLVLRPKEARRQ